MSNKKTHKGSHNHSLLYLIYPILFRSKAKKVRIVAVGIGDYKNFQGQLEEIAGKNVYNTSNFEDLSNLFDDILTETCSE